MNSLCLFSVFPRCQKQSIFRAQFRCLQILSTPPSPASKTGIMASEPNPAPLSGIWLPNKLSHLSYGPGSVEKHLLSLLPTSSSKAFIITTNSLATKTPLIKIVESLLTPQKHAGTFSNISQHAPIAQVDSAATQVLQDPQIDTLISIGGGSPIDSAKAISHRYHEKSSSEEEEESRAQKNPPLAAPQHHPTHPLRSRSHRHRRLHQFLGPENRHPRRPPRPRRHHLRRRLRSHPHPAAPVPEHRHPRPRPRRRADVPPFHLRVARQTPPASRHSGPVHLPAPAQIQPAR